MQEQHEYMYIDVDINSHCQKLSLSTAFVHATDTRYGFSSKSLRALGGSERARIPDLLQLDHDWAPKLKELNAVATTPSITTTTDTDLIQIKPPPHGNRIIIQLYWKESPLACQNFCTICKYTPKTAPVGASGKKLTYVNSKFHRVIPKFMIQGGDFVFGNGSGGESIYNGKKFKDEKAGLTLKHDQIGIVSMGNSGKHSNTSQFFITLDAAPQCDGKHVVFGRIISGFELLKYSESLQEKYAPSKQQEPIFPLEIIDTGIYQPFAIPANGYWYNQPDEDASSYLGYTPVFVCQPRILVVIPKSKNALSVQQKFQSLLSSFSLVTFLQVDDNMEDSNAIQDYLTKMVIDVILIAFACRQCAPKCLPSSKEWEGINVEEVVFTIKPIEAIAAVKKSWILKRPWTFDIEHRS